MRRSEKKKPEGKGKGKGPWETTCTQHKKTTFCQVVVADADAAVARVLTPVASRNPQ